MSSNSLRVPAATPFVRASELQRALDAGELRLYFQPVVRMSDGAIVGAEALIRWQHPTRGLLLPGAFVADAEANGMIVPIGNWVIERGIQQASWWSRRRPDFKLSLNVAVSQLRGRHLDLADTVREQLKQSNLRPENVCLEITETQALSSDDAPAIDAMREIGVAIALDDLATGHAAPRILAHLHMDVLKIDRSHVHAVRTQPAAKTVITHMLLLARKLSMTSVAEGIETASDHSALSRLGCTHAQGFRYSPAVNVPAFTELLQVGRLPLQQDSALA